MMAEEQNPAIPPVAMDCSHLDTPAQIYWQQRGIDLKSTEGIRIKEASAKWTGMLSAVAGVAGITAVLSSYDELRELSRNWQLGIVVALLIALLLIVYANFSAFNAEVGDFKEFRATAENTCNFYMNEPLRRTAEMARSRAAVLVGLGLLVAAILALGLAPKESSAKNFMAIRTTGEVACGRLQTNSTGIVSIVDESGGTVRLNLSGDVKLADLIEVPSCGRAD
jgi:hypothetical protein